MCMLSMMTWEPFHQHGSNLILAWISNVQDEIAFSALLAICVGNSPFTGEFPSQRPVTRSFDVFFDLLLNKRLTKPSRRWWFETPPRSLWRHRNGCHSRGTTGWWWTLLHTEQAWIWIRLWIKNATHFILTMEHRVSTLTILKNITNSIHLYPFVRLAWIWFSREWIVLIVVKS